MVDRTFTHLLISKFKTAGGGAYIRRGDFTEDFLRYEYGGLYLEGIMAEFYGIFPKILDAN